MTPAALRRLLSLAETQKVRDLARLDALTKMMLAFDAEIAAARAAPAADHAAGFGAAPFALRGARQAWSDARVAALGRDKAALAPEMAMARAAATQSLGKHKALEHLLEKAERQAAALKEAREERDRG